MTIPSPTSAGRKIARPFLGLVFLAAFAGCDRGWSYRAIGGVPIMANGFAQQFVRLPGFAGAANADIARSVIYTARAPIAQACP